MGGLYGAGIYFASEACKASQYAKKNPSTGTKVIFVSRVLLGDPHYLQAAFKDRRPPQRDHAPVGVMHDSCVANTSRSQVHREFVLYDHRAAYPEYIVHFTEP